MKLLTSFDLFAPHIDTLKAVFAKVTLHQQRYIQEEGHLIDNFQNVFDAFKKETGLDNEEVLENSDKKLIYRWPALGLTWCHGTGGQNPSYLEFKGTFFARNLTLDKKEFAQKFLNAGEKSFEATYHFSTIHIATDIKNVLPQEVLPEVDINTVCPINRHVKWYKFEEIVFPVSELKKPARDRDLRKATSIVKTLTSKRSASYQVQLYSKLHELSDNTKKHTKTYHEFYAEKFKDCHSVTRCEFRIFGQMCFNYLKLWLLNPSEASFCSAVLNHFFAYKKYRYRSDSLKTRMADWPVHPNWEMLFSNRNVLFTTFAEIEQSHNIQPIRTEDSVFYEKTPDISTSSIRYASALKELNLTNEKEIANLVKSAQLAIQDKKTRSEKFAETQEYLKKLQEISAGEQSLKKAS